MFLLYHADDNVWLDLLLLCWTGFHTLWEPFLRKWEYQSSLCEDEVLSWPDANLPFLLPGESYFLACICLVPSLTSIWPTRLGCSLSWPPWLAPLLGQPWVQVERWFVRMLINTSSDHCSQASMPSGKIHQLRKKTGEAFISFLNSWGYFAWIWPGIDLDFLAGAGRCYLHIMLFFTHLDCWLISQGFAKLYFCRKQKL